VYIAGDPDGISTGTQDILAEDLCGLPLFLQANAGVAPESRYDRFAPTYRVYYPSLIKPTRRTFQLILSLADFKTLLRRLFSFSYLISNSFL
jgi:hypothetical protein